MSPLTARIYLEAYYDLSDPKISQDLLPLLEEFNAWQTIPVATLQDTWPEGEWEEPESAQGGSEEGAVPERETLQITNPKNSKSLRDGAMATVLQTLLDGTDEDTGLLSEAELLTDFLPNLKAKIYERADTLKPSSHVLNLLCRALEEEIDVDLSPFRTLSAEDVSHVVSRLREHGKMQTLCISNRRDLTEGDLQVMLRGATGLKALYILEDPQIDAQGMNTLLKDCDLYSSDLLREAILCERVGLDTNFMQCSPNNEVPAGQVCVEDYVSQLIWIRTTQDQAIDRRICLDSGSMNWKFLQQDDGRSGLYALGRGLRYNRYPLGVPLPLLRTVAGLLRILKWGSFARLFDTDHFSRAAACAFAMAKSITVGNELAVESVGSGHGFGIVPLPKGLYLGKPDKIFPGDGHLEPGRWAIIFIHKNIDGFTQKELEEIRRREAGKKHWPFAVVKEIRYALVTPSTGSDPSVHDFIVADVPTYLEHIMAKTEDKGKIQECQKLVEAWNSGIAAMDGVGFYGDEDIRDILPRVFPNQEAFASGFEQK